MSHTVIITGVLGGIGLATARLFQQQDWTVIGIDVRSVTSQPEEVDHYICADISDETAWPGIEQKIVTYVDCVHGLINNAALQICKPLIETTPDEWDQVMSVNLRAVYLGIRQLYPLLSASLGSVVNVSSVHAIATSQKIAAYATSKGGLLALTRALALELAPQIRVNAILPGAVDTPMLRSGLSRGHIQGKDPEELVTALGQKHAMRRVGYPHEIAEAIYFLTDYKRSSFITGQALIVDGGATIRLSTE